MFCQKERHDLSALPWGNAAMGAIEENWMKLAVWCRAVVMGLAAVGAGCGGGDDEAPPPVAVVDACATLPAAATLPTPASATGAYLCAAGVGVSDLEASVTFYKSGFGMTERARITRTDRNEVVLDSADKKGSQLVLYRYTDGSARVYNRN